MLVLCQTITYLIVLNSPNNLIKYCYLHYPDEETNNFVKRLGPIHTACNGRGTTTWVLHDPKARLNYLTSLLPLGEKIHIQVLYGGCSW